MTTGDLALVVAVVLCALGFAALVVVLTRVLDALRALRREIVELRTETLPLLDDLRDTTAEARGAVREARRDLDRFDRVLGSAEAISDAVSGSGRAARIALATPVIKATALASGTRRVARRLGRARRRELEAGR